MNILNEKIYIFLWFWFIALSVVSGVAVLLSIAVIFLPQVREAVVKRRFKPANNANSIPGLIRKTQIGDFLIVHLLGQNMSTPVYNEVMEEVCRNLQLDSNGPPVPSLPPPTPLGHLEMSPIYPTMEKRTDV